MALAKGGGGVDCPAWAKGGWTIRGITDCNMDICSLWFDTYYSGVIKLKCSYQAHVKIFLL